MSPSPRQHQQVLFLWLSDSALDAAVVAWSLYDGATPKGSPVPPVDIDAEPVYATGLAALQDGWRLIQAAPLIPPAPGAELHTSYLRHEFVFERFAAPAPS
jgi:hypothetical protein